MRRESATALRRAPAGTSLPSPVPMGAAGRPRDAVAMAVAAGEAAPRGERGRHPAPLGWRTGGPAPRRRPRGSSALRSSGLPCSGSRRGQAKTARKPLKKLGVINLLQGRTALGSRPRAEQPPPRLALSPPVTHRASRRGRGVDLSCGLLHSV